MKIINVLIFPAGEVNSIELHDALCTCVNVKVFGASSIERHGSYVFENYLPTLPLIKEDKFIDELNKQIKANDIDLIFPTHDSVAFFLSENRDKIDCKIIVSDDKTAKICRYKNLTYSLFKDEFFCPEVYDSFKTLPVFVKPIDGQGSQGTLLIKEPSEIPTSTENMVITEYLPGEEYTVDCLSTFDGVLSVISPRIRERTMAGISTEGQTVPLTEEIREIANKINEKLSFRGLWWFQIKRDKNGRLKLLEVSTRCAGTMALTRARGINLPLLSVYTFMGYPIEVFSNTYKVKLDSTLIRRYKLNIIYDYIYIDFDDTITIRGKVNFKVIAFLYQSKNRGKKIHLITKHDGDIKKALDKYSISELLFDKIIHINKTENKSSYIWNGSSIFIDNSWLERKDVRNRNNIPVFDVDGIDALMDWRQ